MIASFLAAALLLIPLPAAAGDISSKRYLEDVKHLASDALKGRGTGTAGLDAAAEYIGEQFRKSGLEPLADGGYCQSFPVTVKSELGESSIAVTLDGDTTSLRQTEDFIPFNFSGSGPLKGAVVFAGYGISAPEYGYDDYLGIDVRGKIVLVLRHEPQEFEDKSVFDGRVYTEHSQLFSKAVNARAHGAAGLLYVNDTANHGSDAMDKFTSHAGPGNAGLPFVQIRSELVEAWFQAAGKDFKGTQEAMDKDRSPRSFAFPPLLSVEGVVQVRTAERPVCNVVGYLPGLTPEYIVVGAHYDHLGLGEQYSLDAQANGSVHFGADDNASGTAGVINLARWFAAQPKMKRGVLFMGFAGEELGLLGSSHYVHHPERAIGDAVAMINMDMIGRIRDGKVFVGGIGSGSGLRQLIDSEKAGFPFELDLSEQGIYGSSDHTSFKTRMIPSLFFFSGLHADYHKPGDTWDKINAKGAAKLLDLVARVIDRLAQASARPEFTRPVDASGSHSSSASGIPH